MNKTKYINREISWLDFNSRVLQEAAEKSVPILERLRFIGIFSNNLDEFFKVRYATVQRIALSDKSGKKALGTEAKELLEKITSIVIKKQKESLMILNSIEEELKHENIFFINEKQVVPEQFDFLNDFFIRNVSPALVTIILSNKIKQDFSDNRAFLVAEIELNHSSYDSKYLYALIEIPKDIDRFIVLPKNNNIQYIMLLDDLIRFNFHLIFNMFNYKNIVSHMVKITRDAELDFDSDLSKSYINKITESVKDRLTGDPVRLVYDKNISKKALEFVINKLGISSFDSLIPGGRYHDRRDYMNFPSLNRDDLLYKKNKPLNIKGYNLEKNLLKHLLKNDFLQYTPYHTFSYVVKFLRDAALDPDVKTIKITLYRLARQSNVISSLINAAKNGKKVLVQIELQARFDETNNITYAEQMQAAGVELIFGIPGLKVHSKICIIEKKINNKNKRYGFISTGNLNEDTAKIYTDYTLFTANQKVLREVNKVFNFLQVHYKLKKYKHLIVSPHYTHSVIVKMIDNEIENASSGLASGIKLKLNAITNFAMIEKLYEASNAGVPIKMIVRGICCLIPGVKGMSENIEVISVVDKFLEHPRVYHFTNLDKPKIYISSADFMTRNIENRVEVATPIYDYNLQQQIIDVFDIIWNDNVKARRINGQTQNKFIKNNKPPVRSQIDIYEYYRKNINL